MAEHSLHDKIYLRGAVDAWARYAIERFQKQLKNKNIGVTGNLYRSFEKEVKRSGSDIDVVFIRFAMYGRFRDMGVGNGMKAYERKTNKINLIASKQYGSNVSFSRRQPKRWFNKPKMAQIYKLREILAKNMLDAVVSNAEEEFSNTQYKVNI